ncbi:MAG: thioredoxin-dependent thiol peroxidase [Candidatus Nanoarchaeia archaeon]
MAKTKLNIGDNAPDFELMDQEGKKHSLKMYKGKKIVLYFYPKDDTPGCTAEACSIRDNYSAFKKAGLIVLGVSADKQESHKKFADKYELPFTLLSDPGHEVLEKYGVWTKKNLYGKIMMGIARMTFIIDEKGKILKIYEKVKPAEHAEEILKDLK